MSELRDKITQVLDSCKAPAGMDAMDIAMAVRRSVKRTSKLSQIGALQVWDELKNMELAKLAKRTERTADRRFDAIHWVTGDNAPVVWAGRTFGQLTDGEKRRAAAQAGKQMQAELEAAAPEITRIMDTAQVGPHTVSVFDGQRKVGEGTYIDRASANLIAHQIREAGYTTRVRPAGLIEQDK